MKLLVKEEKSSFLFLSPSVGKVRLNIGSGQRVCKGQAVGQFYCLGDTFDLTSDYDGTVSKIEREGCFGVGYNDVLFHLDTSSAETIKETKKVTIEKEDLYIKSPMDGMFYLSSSPESPPFVVIGDEIAPGQTVGLIEVMKCFYPVKYEGEFKAKISAITIKNGSAVQSGKEIFALIIS